MNPAGRVSLIQRQTVTVTGQVIKTIGFMATYGLGHILCFVLLWFCQTCKKLFLAREQHKSRPWAEFGTDRGLRTPDTVTVSYLIYS